MKPTRRSSLFLLELMLAILLFSLAAAICVQVFVKSHTLSKKSTNLNQAVFAASSIAELLRSEDVSPEFLLQEYPFAEENDNRFFIHFDEDWIHTTASEASYTAVLSAESDDMFVTGEITVLDILEPETALYELEITKYMRKEGQ